MTDVFPEAGLRLTPDAQARFDAYLDQVRATLAGCAEVSPEDIEQDLRAHVAAEFPPGTGPVTLARLESVLARLGRPEQWLAEPERPLWRRTFDWVRGRPAAVRRWGRRSIDAIREGPEDWRLAYLTFGLFAIGVIIIPAIVLFLPLSYFVARAALARARQNGYDLGPQRWLIYPPLVAISLPLLAIVLLWPVAPAGALAHEIWRKEQALIHASLGWPRGLCEFLTYIYCFAGALSLWSVILGFVCLTAPRLPAALFPPFVSGPGRSFGAWLFAPGLCLFAGWLSLGARALPAAEIVQDMRWFQDDPRDWEAPRRSPARSEGIIPSREKARDDRSSKGAVPQLSEIAQVFLRALRAKDVDGLVAIANLPFYTGRSQQPLGPRELAVIGDTVELRSFFARLVQLYDQPDEVPTEVFRIVSHAKGSLSGQDRPKLEGFLAEDDWRIVVGRPGKEVGSLFVRIVNGQPKVIGVGK